MIRLCVGLWRHKVKLTQFHKKKGVAWHMHDFFYSVNINERKMKRNGFFALFICKIIKKCLTIIGNKVKLTE